MVATPLGRRKLSPTRIEHRERMRSDILKAARELIAQQGVDALTMRSLGKRVGVTAATLYGYFSAKESVLEALLDEKMSAMNEFLLREAEGVESGLPRLLAYARGYRNFALNYPDFYQMFIYKLDPPDWDRIQFGEDSQRQVLTVLHLEIKGAIDRGELIAMDVNTLLRILWSVAHGYVSLELTNCFGSEKMLPEERETMFLDHMMLLTRGFVHPDRVAGIEQTLRSGLR